MHVFFQINLKSLCNKRDRLEVKTFYERELSWAISVSLWEVSQCWWCDAGMIIREPIKTKMLWHGRLPKQSLLLTAAVVPALPTKRRLKKAFCVQHTQITRQHYTCPTSHSSSTCSFKGRPGSGRGAEACCIAIWIEGVFKSSWTMSVLYVSVVALALLETTQWISNSLELSAQ